MEDHSFLAEASRNKKSLKFNAPLAKADCCLDLVRDSDASGIELAFRVALVGGAIAFGLFSARIAFARQRLLRRK